MDKAKICRIIGVVLLIIGLITLGFIIADYLAGRELADKILDEIAWYDSLDYVIRDAELRSELYSRAGYSFVAFSLPFIVVAIIFIAISEKLRLMKFG